MSAATPISIGRKDDASKARMDLLPAGPIVEVAKALTFGADRYGDDNWQRVDRARSRYHAAALRHIFAWAHGSKSDSDSGLSHLAHAVCCLLFLLWFDMRSGDER